MSEEKYVTVESQVNLIRKISYGEISVAVVILLAQTIAVAASYDFASRSLTGIWTSWFFFITAAVALFWSSRCTFNGLLAVLILQIIAATMSIPLFTACCVMFGVYPFVWSTSEDGASQALVGSSLVIMITNIVMMLTSIAEMILNIINAYNCYFLAYVGKPKVEDPIAIAGGVTRTYEADEVSIGSSSSSSSGGDDGSSSSSATPPPNQANGNLSTRNAIQVIQLNRPQLQHQPLPANSYDDPSMPQPPPDLTLTPTDLFVIKYCGMIGVVLAIVIFCAQITMFALATDVGIRIGIGIWAAGFYSVTGIITVYFGWKPSSQKIIAIFILQNLQLVFSIPLAGISYYIVAVFGSCIQEIPVNQCPKSLSAGLCITLLGALMANSATVQGLVSLVLVLICSQTVCGIRCMISGATVYPTL